MKQLDPINKVVERKAQEEFKNDLIELRKFLDTKPLLSRILRHKLHFNIPTTKERNGYEAMFESIIGSGSDMLGSQYITFTNMYKNAYFDTIAKRFAEKFEEMNKL